jgi:hypothetical protein
MSQSLPWGNSPWYPLYRRLGGPQARCYDEERNLLSVLGINPQFLKTDTSFGYLTKLFQKMI